MGSKLFFAILLIAALPGSLFAVSVLDLSGSTLTGTANNATFTVYNHKTAGTGALDPFLRVNNDNPATTCNASNATRECGFNTDGAVTWDTKSDPHTHAILMSAYTGSFVLDINEPNGAGRDFLSIDQLQIFGANFADVGSATYGGSNPTGSVVNSNLTLLWSLDGPSANTDYSIFAKDRFSGSGTTDLKIDIAKSVFYQNASTFQYLVLFTNLGNVDRDQSTSAAAEGGFEEFALLAGAPIDSTVPEPAAVWLLLTLVAFVGSTLVGSRKGTFARLD
jgi:hypothetical protein